MKNKIVLLGLAGSLSLALSGFADTVNLDGTTAASPTFLRPTETGARSFLSAPYAVYQFNVSTSGPFSFTLSAIDPASYDTFLHLFVNGFDPADVSDPALNFLAGNDDAVFGSPDLGSGLTNVSLTAGTAYFLVVDGFAGSDAGAFHATISGPGAINVVPEPSSITLLAFASLGFIAVLRRRLRNARA